MTKEQLDKIASDYLNDCESELDMLEVFAVAKEALEQEPCDDCVSRAELLKALDTWDKFGVDDTGHLFRLDNLSYPHYEPYIHYRDVIKAVKGMPSVQPKRDKHDEEIIKETVASIWGKPPYTEVLDKIRAEIEQNAYPIVHGVNNHELGMTLYGILQVIDKYKAGEEE